MNGLRTGIVVGLGAIVALAWVGRATAQDGIDGAVNELMRAPTAGSRRP